MNLLQRLIPLLFACWVGYGQQSPPATIVARTPPPKTDELTPVVPPKAVAAKKNTATSAKADVTDQGLKATPVAPPPVVPPKKEAENDAKRGGNYELDLEDGSIEEETPEDELVDSASVAGPRRGGFGLSENSVGSREDVARYIEESPEMQAAKKQAAKQKSVNQGPSQESQALTAILESNKKIQEDLKKLEAQEQQQKEQRDSRKTDAMADAEFAEAMASRRASSIARAKGLALIPALRTIEMRLLTFASSEQGGKFKAIITQDVWDATFASVGIPRGTLARGYIEAAASDGDTRIRMTVTEFILPSGDSIQLRVPDAVTDPIGGTGVKAEVNHRWILRTGSAVAYGVMSALSGSGTRSGYASNASFDDVLRSNLAGSFGQMGAQSFQTGMQIRPTVELKEGEEIAMILGNNLYLVPWERMRSVIPAPNETSVH
jgi:type IV secretory pathway VirB10-like protein